MGHIRRILAALVVVAALGGASMATEDCGSVPADVDGATQDASVDHSVFDAHVPSDAPVESDAQSDASDVVPVVCPDPDAGYYITVNGDGDAQTLSSNTWLDAGVPAAIYLPPCGRIFVIQGSASSDGGTFLDFQYDVTNQSPPPAPTGPAIAMYSRGDGTYFYSAPEFGQPIFTKLDAPGGSVAGTYAVTVAADTQPDAAPLSLSGTFCMLRLPDGPTLPCPP
jgi:hypothetical protein